MASDALPKRNALDLADHKRDGGCYFKIAEGVRRERRQHGSPMLTASGCDGRGGLDRAAAIATVVLAVVIWIEPQGSRATRL